VNDKPRTVDELLAEARSKLDRVGPGDIEAEVADGALVVDIRPVEQRERDGEMPGTIVIDRNVLEWRLDPGSEHRIPEAQYGRRVIVVCNEGYSSSLAAAMLRQLGLDATDLEGGFQALRKGTRGGAR
jgi:rhodanese-related sulfurtransferase